MKRYADENFPRAVAEQLRLLGHDVLTVAEAGFAGRGVPDHEVLAHAHRLGRAVVTLDRLDFLRLHAKSQEHSGIVVCTHDIDVEGQAARIDAVIGGAENVGRNPVSAGSSQASFARNLAARMRRRSAFCRPSESIARQVLRVVRPAR